MLILKITRNDERMVITTASGERITIEVMRPTEAVRLGIDAPQSAQITREPIDHASAKQDITATEDMRRLLANLANGGRYDDGALQGNAINSLNACIRKGFVTVAGIREYAITPLGRRAIGLPPHTTPAKPVPVPTTPALAEDA